MNFRIRFRSKLLMLTIVPLAVAQLVTLFAVMRIAERDVDRRARESLTIGGTVVSQYLGNRSEQMRTSVQVLAADFGLKEAVATGDAVTIRSVLENHRHRVGADIAVLLDVDGRVVAATEGVPTNGRRLFVGRGDDDRSVATESTVRIDDVTFQAIAVPLRAPLTIGRVVLGFAIDHGLADRIASLTGLDVTIVSTDETPYTIATTSPAGPKPAAALQSLEVPVNEVYLVNEAGIDCLELATPFVADDRKVLVVLQRSVQAAMAPYTEAKHGLIAFGAVLLVFVAATAAWVAGGMARPLRLLTDAAQRMISGQYDVDIPVRTDDEVGQLASSFEAMSKAIADRERRISHQALHDALTDLPNRAHIVQILHAAIQAAQHAGSEVAVLSVRLSRMNAISSTLGHVASDEVIRLAARHLSVNMNEGETLGHVGTNEFVLILPGSGLDDALDCADRIAAILSAGVTLGRINISLQSEIGISGFPSHGVSAADLLRNASIARSEADAASEPVSTYRAGRDDYYVRQLRIVNDLRGALQRGEVQLHFQPKIALPGGDPCGAEALIRWDHPEFGLLLPDEFVPAAEQAGTIVHVTRYVLKQALSECRKWRESGFELGVSVNLSARDLRDEYLPYYVLQLLKEEDIPAPRLTLEVTENTVMEGIHHAAAVLQCLRDIGVRISMDDFGTGHSSLAQLKALPLHELKIDKSFVVNLLGDEHNEAIVRITIDLAHNMKLDVVAEGVEDEQTMRYLAGEGCEQAQGFFLSRPVTSGDLRDWLDTYQARSWADRRSGRRAFTRR